MKDKDEKKFEKIKKKKKKKPKSKKISGMHQRKDKRFPDGM